MKLDTSISIILPIFNEQGNIDKVIGEINNYFIGQNIFKNYEIIAVDDGSSDNTGKILIELTKKISCLTVITNRKNLGYGLSLISGLRISRYPLIFFMDADGQFNIREIGRMIPYIGDFDIIAGYRYKRVDLFYRVILGKTYGWVVFILFGLKFKDINCGFKLFRKKTLDFENNIGSAGVFYTGVFLKAKNKGFKIKEIAVEHFPRLKGRQTGANPKVIFNAVIDLINLKYYQLCHKI